MARRHPPHALGPLFRARPPRWPLELVAEFSAVFKTGPQHCALVGIMPDGTVLMMLTYGDSNLYAAEVNLPE